MSAVPVEETLRALDLTGVFANAVLGGILARGARLDPIGFGTLAIISGLGGGMIRDGQRIRVHGTAGYVELVT